MLTYTKRKLYTQRYRSGHNGADSKGSRPRHSRECKSSRFLRLSRKCFIFLEFWMNAFYHRPCKSRAKFKHNLIRRDIEVVITGLTRNQFALTRTRVRIPLSPPNSPQFSRIAGFILHYISSINLNLSIVIDRLTIVKRRIGYEKNLLRKRYAWCG